MKVNSEYSGEFRKYTRELEAEEYTKEERKRLFGKYIRYDKSEKRNDFYWSYIWAKSTLKISSPFFSVATLLSAVNLNAAILTGAVGFVTGFFGGIYDALKTTSSARKELETVHSRTANSRSLDNEIEDLGVPIYFK